MKSKQVTEFYQTFLEIEEEELNQTIAHYEEMLRICKEKLKIVENTISAIDGDKYY